MAAAVLSPALAVALRLAIEDGVKHTVLLKRPDIVADAILCRLPKNDPTEATVSGLLSLAESVTKFDQPRWTVPAEFMHVISPLLARDAFASDLAFDFDGILLVAESASSAPDSRGAPAPNVKANLKNSACARLCAPGWLTCAPEGAISKGALTMLMIPRDSRAAFESWLRSSLVDARMESDIASRLKPVWCAGLNIANIISSGFCGGPAADRKKKQKKKKTRAQDSARDTISLKKQTKKGRTGKKKKGGGRCKKAGGRGRGGKNKKKKNGIFDESDEEEEEEAGDRLPAAMQEIIAEFREKDPSLAEAARAVEADEIECGLPCFAATVVAQASPSFYDEMKNSNLNFERERGDEEAEEEEEERVAPEMTIDREILRAAAPNAWVDLRAASGFGSPWTRVLLPCGCTLALLAQAVYATRKIYIIRQVENKRSVLGHEAATALVVELMSGTFTRHEARSAVMRDLASSADGGEEFLQLASEATQILAQSSISQQWTKVLREWGVVMTLAARSVAGKATDVRPLSGLAQGWYFDRVLRRTSWIHDVFNEAPMMRGRIEEVISTAALTRQTAWDASGDALAYVGIPADAAWALALAVEKMQMTARQVGIPIPLGSAKAVIVYPGASRSGGAFDVTPDGRDAYVAGAMAHALGSGQTVAMDCALLFPFAFLVLSCGPSCRTLQATRSWDVLIASAVAFLSDACAASHDTAGDVLLRDPGKLVPGDDEAIFQGYRVLGKLIVLACYAAGPRMPQSRADMLRRGIYCAARPKRKWVVPDPAPPPPVDRRHRTMANVRLLVSTAAEESGDAALHLLTSIALAALDDDPPPAVCRQLSHYEVPLGSTSSTSAPAPCLALLSSQFVKFSGEKTLDVALPVWRFVAETEILARTLRHQIRPELANKWIESMRSSDLVGFRDACADAFKVGRGVPLAFYPCGARYINSVDYLPMADHPMTNPFRTAVSCTCCGARRSPSHRLVYPYASCYPGKEGLLMSEIVHATSGIVILPHATAEPEVAAAGLRYPMGVVDGIQNECRH
jgi:hypothetical protein